MSEEPHLFHGECQADPVDLRIRQGDVFEWLHPNPDSRWGEHGLVVTADCDISLRKHQGILSYVPVVSCAVYLATLFLPDRVTKAVQSSRETFLGAIRSYQRKLPDFIEPLSAKALDDWLDSEGLAGVAAGLSIPDEPDLVTLQRHLGRISQGEASIESGGYQELCDSLVALRAAGGDSAGAEQRLAADTEGTLANLPGDAFFIGKLGPGRDSGYVVYLRHVREIRDEQIATSVPALEHGGVTARRLSRLRSPYVYRLTQQLGDVFASIGLPDEYERHRSNVARGLRGAPTDPEK